MDLIELIAVIAILSVGSLLTGGKKFGKKASPRDVAADVPADEPAADQYGDVETDETWADFFGEEQQAAAPADEESNQYFSYETLDADKVESPSEPVAVEEHEMPETAVQEVQHPAYAGNFDLRQAFIYQTILERVNI